MPKDGTLEHEAKYVSEHISLPKNPVVTYTSHHGFFSISIDDVVQQVLPAEIGSVNFLSIKKAAQELCGFFIKYLPC